jgi:restriction system protein
VKLKMAKNSLFAILLRSPWWISFTVVAVFALASAALLPRQYVVFGLMGAIPFLVIGCIAAYRQMRAPSARTVEQTLQRTAAMPWREFQDALERAYRQQGFTVTRLDGRTADLQLTLGAQTTLVTAKRWKAGSHGAEPLRALDKARRAQDASQCVYISLAEPNEATQRFARQNTVTLVNGVALVQLLGKLP